MTDALALRNDTTGDVIAARVARAATPWQRLCGLLPYGRVSPDCGLWFDRCSAVHTIGMRAPIDIIFIDAQRRVVGTRHRVMPNRPFVTHRRAYGLIELGASPVARRVRVGDVLRLAAGAVDAP